MVEVVLPVMAYARATDQRPPARASTGDPVAQVVEVVPVMACTRSTAHAPPAHARSAATGSTVEVGMARTDAGCGHAAQPYAQHPLKRWDKRDKPKSHKSRFAWCLA